MNNHALPIAAAILIAASSAVAAQQATTKGSQATPSHSGAQAGAKSNTQSGSMEAKAMTQAKVTKSLQNAGFTEIRVVDATYLIHAKTSDGNNVVIYIDPPSAMTASSADGSADGAGNSASPGSNAGTSSGTSSGSSSASGTKSAK